MLKLFSKFVRREGGKRNAPFRHSSTGAMDLGVRPVLRREPGADPELTGDPRHGHVFVGIHGDQLHGRQLHFGFARQ